MGGVMVDNTMGDLLSNMHKRECKDFLENKSLIDSYSTFPTNMLIITLCLTLPRHVIL